jgi:hypothetical protein
MRILITRLNLLVLLNITIASAPARDTIEVEAAVRPDANWEEYSTRTLAQAPDLAALPLDSELDRYGGWTGYRANATGFFYATNVIGRWWLVDPQGGLFLHKGISAVRPLHTVTAEPAFQSKFGTDTNWGVQVTSLLRQNGFNGAGAWSSLPELQAAPKPLIYTCTWNFMGAYGKKRGGTSQQAGHTGYPNDCIFVFDPAFETFCDEYARQLITNKDDPCLLGHFSDNELPFKRALLTNYLVLPENDPGRQAAEKWLRSRHGEKATVADVTDQDKKDFLAVVVDRYFRIVSKAIHKYDPNHLFLGSRFYGADVGCPEVFKAAGPYLDVVSVNYYHTWTPKPADLEMWASESGRPVIITEWYAKGMDSGLSNQSGVGWVVKTQRDRGLFYQNFTLGLLASKVCVGWHWLQYADNDPADAKSDPSNKDSNKGIVNVRYEPYAPLLDAMRQVNARSYALARYFQQSGKH